MPKYSLILPVRNGGEYLRACIQSIVSIPFDDFELLISDDHSIDGTMEYLRGLDHPRIQVLTPPEGMSMAEHWGWALDRAQGDWLIFVGQDDGLQSYFFELAEILTRLAEKSGIRTVMSSRVYYWWPGCEAVYGDRAVLYVARPEISLRTFGSEALASLLGLQDYFELPQMYTTSLFHKDLIAQAKRNQGGKLFLAHPQDANLAAIAYAFETRYLHSEIPLGWVGSSPKSAGMAISSSCMRTEASAESDDLKHLRKDYLAKISSSAIQYHPLAGDFSLGSCAVYFWGALLQTRSNFGRLVRWFHGSSILKYLLFAGVHNEVCRTPSNQEYRWALFEDILRLNACHQGLVRTLARVQPRLIRIWREFRSPFRLPWHVRSQVVRTVRSGNRDHWPSFLEAYEEAGEKVAQSGLLDALRTKIGKGEVSRRFF